MIAVRKLRGWAERMAKGGAVGFRFVEFEGDNAAEVALACVSLSEAAIMAGAVSCTVERWRMPDGTVANVTAVWELPK